jgi:MFS family permease
VLMPAFARETLGVGETGYGALLSANGLGALSGALTVATFGSKWSRRFLISGGLGIFSLMLLLLACVQNYYLALTCMAIGGWGMLLYFSTTNTLIQTFVSDEFRGRVMGVWALVFGGMMPVGGLEAGTVSHFLGVKWTIAIGALVCACAAAAAARRTNPDSEPEAGAGRPIAS